MRYKRKLYKTIMRRLKKRGRRWSRNLLKPKAVLVFFVIASLGSLILLHMQETQKIYATDLLNTIAKGESDYNYNAYFGNPTNTAIHFTSMPVGKVLAWQKQFVKEGNPSSAVGRYQFIDTTLQGLVRQLHIDENATFDAALQDKLAVALLERRGMREYADGKMSREKFAYNLSKEWAALPKSVGDNPEQSYYAGDGLNGARVSVAELYASIATVHKI